MSKRNKKPRDLELHRVADQQLINLRRRARQLLAREFKILRQRFATKAELKRIAKKLEQSDTDQAETLHGVLNQIDERFDDLENAS